MKNITKTTTDPIAKARKLPKFKEYSKEARARIVLATMKTYAQLKTQLLKDKEIKRAYDILEPEFTFKV